jgi:TonB family protein
VVAPPPPTPVAAIAREAPIGRLFEPGDVDEAPQVATRVEPQLPGDLPVGRLNDIVVVRVLVSQTGHPFRVNLLRRSKVGRSLDDAVVAAVTKWTFSPARKRGEAVSCWYNIGVPLGPS